MSQQAIYYMTIVLNSMISTFLFRFGKKQSKLGVYVNIARFIPETGTLVPLIIRSPVDEKNDIPDSWSFAQKV